MARTIDDFAIEETKDGYRIEIKGDKETIRALVANLSVWPRWYARRWVSGGETPEVHRDQWMKALAACGPWSREEVE